MLYLDVKIVQQTRYRNLHLYATCTYECDTVIEKYSANFDTIFFSSDNIES